MKNLNDIRIKALRLIESTMVLEFNVNNGCYSDREELEINKARFEGIKKWAKENNQINSIIYWFNNKNFGQQKQFIASEYKTFFIS